MKLSDVASLQSGLVLNRKEARSPEETEKIYKRLTLRSLGLYNEIDHDGLDNFASKETLDASLLTQPGDIVIKLFAPIVPVVITENDAGYVIPSQLAVIRIKNDAVLPDYLRYWLSTSDVTDLLQSHERWQSQKTITIKTFAELEVPVPPLKEQRAIVGIVSANTHREQLYRKLIDEQNKLTALNIQKIIGGEQK